MQRTIRTVLRALQRKRISFAAVDGLAKGWAFSVQGRGVISIEKLLFNGLVRIGKRGSKFLVDHITILIQRMKNTFSSFHIQSCF